ncbi:MAG TPA: iron-containing alcohol dehydrogenase [Pilimelia sp.]|nr:iron-containing alcohol dehydrogenase [Pilimelia sp.]
MGQALVVGPGALRALPDSVAAVGRSGAQSRVMTIVGAGFHTRPWVDEVRTVLDTVADAVRVHRGLPTPESVLDLHAEVVTFRPDVVVAIGGGSVIDAAKAATALAGTGMSGPELAAYIRTAGPVPAAGVPVVAVPTTPGTGAEATPFATVWDRTGRTKLSVAGPAVRPAAAILDPRLLAGLSRAQLASCLLDTLAQGIEAAWSIRSTPTASAYGLAAVAAVAPLLEAVAAGHHTMSARTALMLGGYHSGQAIAIGETTACHAISYDLTLRFGLAHGHACGVVLARLLRYNAAITDRDCGDPRGARHVQSVLSEVVDAFAGAADVDHVAHRIDGFLDRCDLARYDDLAADHRSVAEQALGYRRCHNNPRALDLSTLTALLSASSPSEMGAIQCHA